MQSLCNGIITISPKEPVGECCFVHPNAAHPSGHGISEPGQVTPLELSLSPSTLAWRVCRNSAERQCDYRVAFTLGSLGASALPFELARGGTVAEPHVFLPTLILPLTAGTPI